MIVCNGASGCSQCDKASFNFAYNQRCCTTYLLQLLTCPSCSTALQMSAEVAEAGPSNPAQQATAIPKSPSVSELAKLGAVVDKEPTQPQQQQQKQQASAWKTGSSARGKAPAHAEGQSPGDSAALQMMPTIPSPGQADGTADGAATAAGEAD